MKKLFAVSLLTLSFAAGAFFQPPAASLSQPAAAPARQCGMLITWNPDTANIVDLSFVGEGCESTRTTAVNWAHALVNCMRVPALPCRP